MFFGIRYLLILLWLNLSLTLAACQPTNPPLEFSPNGEIVAEAIALQLKHTSSQLGQQLNIDSPQFKIANIKVRKIEPFFFNGLPTYHLQGIYQINLKFSRYPQKIRIDSFDIYLQRQKEGKTWRLLIKKNDQKDRQWQSYKI